MGQHHRLTPAPEQTITEVSQQYKQIMGSGPRGSARTQATPTRLPHQPIPAPTDQTDQPLIPPITPPPLRSDANKNSSSEPSTTLPQKFCPQKYLKPFSRPPITPQTPSKNKISEKAGQRKHSTRSQNRLTENVTPNSSKKNQANHPTEKIDVQDTPTKTLNFDMSIENQDIPKTNNTKIQSPPTPHYTYSDIVGNTPNKGYLYDPLDPSPPISLQHAPWLPSTHAGHHNLQRGLYTNHFIPYKLPNNTRPTITQYAGPLISKDQLQDPSPHQSAYFKGVRMGQIIDGFREPKPTYGMAQFCNDGITSTSETAPHLQPVAPGLKRDKRKINCELRVTRHRDTGQVLVSLLPSRDIPAHEELCIAYDNHYWHRVQDASQNEYTAPYLPPVYSPLNPTPPTTTLGTRKTSRKRHRTIRYTPPTSDHTRPLTSAPRPTKKPCTYQRPTLTELQALLHPVTENPCPPQSLMVKPSSIPGLPTQFNKGLWSIQHIAKDVAIGEYTGDLLTYKEYHQKYPTDDCLYSFPAGPCPAHAQNQSCPHKHKCPHPHLYLDATNAHNSSTMRYINDCGQATHRVNTTFTLDANRIIIKTTRPITPNEEFFCDYGPNYPWSTTTPRLEPPDPYVTDSDSEGDTLKSPPDPESTPTKTSKRKIKVTILEPIQINAHAHYYKHIEARPTGSRKKQMGVFTKTKVPRGSFITHLGNRINITTHRHRKHSQMALSNALNWSQPLPSQKDIDNIISLLSHCIQYESTTGAVDGHPDINPYNGVGSWGLAITMLINEPSRTQPNAIFCRDGILIIKDIPPNTQIQAHYGPQAEEMRALQGYSIVNNPYITRDLNHHKDLYQLPSRKTVAAIINKWTPLPPLQNTQPHHKTPQHKTNTISPSHLHLNSKPQTKNHFSPNIKDPPNPNHKRQRLLITPHTDKPTPPHNTPKPTPPLNHTSTYWHNNEIPDGRCSAHGCATTTSLSLKDMTTRFKRYIENQIKTYTKYIDQPHTGINTPEYTETIQSLAGGNSQERWLMHCTNRKQELHKLPQSLNQLLRQPQHWENNVAACGGHFFRDFIIDHYQKQNISVEVITVRESQYAQKPSGPITTDTILHLLNNNPDLRQQHERHKLSWLEHLHNNTLIIFINPGGHWHTITPIHLLTKPPQQPSGTAIHPWPPSESNTHASTPKHNTPSSPPPTKRIKTKHTTQLTLKQTLRIAQHKANTSRKHNPHAQITHQEPPPPPPPPPQPPTPLSPPSLQPLTPIPNVQQHTISPRPHTPPTHENQSHHNSRQLTKKTIKRHIQNHIKLQGQSNKTHPPTYFNETIHSILKQHFHLSYTLNSTLTRITPSDYHKWYSPHPQDKPFGAITGSINTFLQNQFTWINLSGPHQNRTHLNQALNAISTSTTPARAVLLTDQQIHHSIHIPTTIRTHTIATFPPHSITFISDNLSDNSHNESDNIPTKSNITTLTILLIETITAPIYHAPNLHTSLQQALPNTQFTFHNNPTWQQNTTLTHYDTFSTFTYPHIPQFDPTIFPGLLKLPIHEKDRSTKTHTTKYLPRAQLTIAAFGIGLVHRRTLIKAGYDPDVLTKENLKRIKHIFRQTTYAIYNRSHKLTQHRKYGAPD